MKLKPLHDRILIKIIEESEKTKGGIIIPDTAKEKPSEGEIIAVGPGIINKDGKRNPLEVKPGDKININCVDEFINNRYHLRNKKKLGITSSEASRL